MDFSSLPWYNQVEFHTSKTIQIRNQYKWESGNQVSISQKCIFLKDNIQGEKEAKDVHYEVGKKVRKAIADIGGMMPEEMPTPKKSLKELERERKKLEIKEQKKLDEIK